MNKTTKRTINLTSTALMAALTCIMAQIAIPMPLGVPMTMQTFAVTLAGASLGSKRGGLSMVIYILLGAAGLPVFSNFTGGFALLTGPTGGFLISFPIMAFIIGLGTPYKKEKPIVFWTFLIIGTVINYIVGTIVFCISTGSTIPAGITVCVIPFIPTAIIKGILGGILGIKVSQSIPEMQ